MKFSRAWVLAGVGVSALGLSMAVQGCSSSSPTSSGAGRVPPTLPPGSPQTSTQAEHNYALHKLFLGDTDRNGVTNLNAWMDYGYNLDEKITTRDSTDVCQLAANAQKSVQVDGHDGIDNSFGANVLQIIESFQPTPTATISDSIDSGGFTIMLDTLGLDQTATETAGGLHGKLFAGGKFNGKPTWTTTDDWPVLPQLLSNPADPTSSKVVFDQAYVVGGTFVSGSPVDVTLNLAFAGQNLTVNVHHATITVGVNGSQGTDGVIAGVINTEELISGLRAVAGHLGGKSLCGGTAFDTIAQEIRGMSDIFVDGTNGPGRPCDGISIGLGFNADEIGRPKSVSDSDGGTADPCEAGGDDGGGGNDSGSPETGLGGL
jgi:hypothetical protein